MSLKNNETKNLLFRHSSLLRTRSALPSGRGLSAGSGILGYRRTQTKSDAILDDDKGNEEKEDSDDEVEESGSEGIDNGDEEERDDEDDNGEKGKNGKGQKKKAKTRRHNDTKMSAGEELREDDYTPKRDGRQRRSSKLILNSPSDIKVSNK